MKLEGSGKQAKASISVGGVPAFRRPARKARTAETLSLGEGSSRNHAKSRAAQTTVNALGGIEVDQSLGRGETLA